MIDRIPVTAVALDAYGTLFQGGSDDLIRLVERLVGEATEPVTAQEALERREELIAELERRPFRKMRERDDWILRTLFEEYGIDRDPEPEVEALHRTYFRVEPYPDARPAVEGLRRRGLELAVVSNSDTAMMARVLEATGFGGSFDAVVTSERARAYKPAPPMFEQVARDLGVEPGAVLHVGDSYTADVVGAKRAGLRAAWLRRPGGLPAPRRPAFEPDLVIESLTELLDRVPTG